MSAHTPGPWHATPLRHAACLFDIGAENGANVAEVYTEKKGGQPEAEAQANARLISSAPDLLAAHLENARILNLLWQELQGRVDAGKLEAIYACARRSENAVATAMEGRS